MKFLILDKRKRVGDLTTPHFAVERIQQELDAKGIEHDFNFLDEVKICVDSGKLEIRLGNESASLKEFTHIIIRGHRTNYEYMIKCYIVDYANKHGIKVQNSEFIKLMPHYNKLYQMVLMADAQIPYVDCCYSSGGQYQDYPEELEKLGFPLIYKHVEGVYRVENIDGEDKLKKNISLINNKEELEKEITTREDPDQYFIQKFVDIGVDYRAIMIGGKFLSGWKREAKSGFLTVSKDSEYTLFNQPDPEFKDLVEKTNQLFKADFCAIDVIYVNNSPYILEINMNPGFKAFETKVEGSKVNVAKEIVENMLNK